MSLLAVRQRPNRHWTLSSVSSLKSCLMISNLHNFQVEFGGTQNAQIPASVFMCVRAEDCRQIACRHLHASMTAASQ